MARTILWSDARYVVDTGVLLNSTTVTLNSTTVTLGDLKQSSLYAQNTAWTTIAVLLVTFLYGKFSCFIR